MLVGDDDSDTEEENADEVSGKKNGEGAAPAIGEHGAKA